MLRFTGEDVELENQLQEALDTMLSVLQYLNASMHQVRIVGYQVRVIHSVLTILTCTKSALSTTR